MEQTSPRIPPSSHLPRGHRQAQNEQSQRHLLDLFILVHTARTCHCHHCEKDYFSLLFPANDASALDLARTCHLHSKNAAPWQFSVLDIFDAWFPAYLYLLHVGSVSRRRPKELVVVMPVFFSW